MPTEPRIYGILAEFSGARELRAAAVKAYEAGYRKMDAYSPFPIDGLAEAIGMTSNRLPLIVLGMALLGGGVAYYMQWWINVVDYPMNVGGRPLHSWPYFIPITFELTILLAALGAVLGMLILNGLPRLHHPLFSSARFDRASQDAFFLAIESADVAFDPARTRRFLEELGSTDVTIVTYDSLTEEAETVEEGTPGGRREAVGERSSGNGTRGGAERSSGPEEAD